MPTIFSTWLGSLHRATVDRKRPAQGLAKVSGTCQWIVVQMGADLASPDRLELVPRRIRQTERSYLDWVNCESMTKAPRPAFASNSESTEAHAELRAQTGTATLATGIPATGTPDWLPSQLARR